MTTKCLKLQVKYQISITFFSFFLYFFFFQRDKNPHYSSLQITSFDCQIQVCACWDKKAKSLPVIVNLEFEQSMNTDIRKPLHLSGGSILDNIFSVQKEFNLMLQNSVCSLY